MPSPTNAQLADKQMNERVESLLKKMTLQEKIGQLSQYSAGSPTGPGTGRDDYGEMVEKGDVGSLLNVVGAAKTNQFQHMAMEKSRLHIPLLFGLDVIHGNRTIFPVPLGLAASFDPALVESDRAYGCGRSAGGWNQLGVFADGGHCTGWRWGRTVESAGEDPYLGSAMARAYIHGYQGSDLKSAQAVAACVKHFAAYGAPIAGRDYYAVDMSELRLRQTYLPTYRAAIDAGAATVMSSFNSLNGVPASANPFLMTQVLRQEWGFNGMVVSDWAAVAELINHGVVSNGADAARKAVSAGVDMDMEGDLYRTRLTAAVQRGELAETVIDEAVRRVLRVKFALGLFDQPYVEESAPYKATAEKRELARKAAEESFVLLKNEPMEGVGRVLPLKPGKTIALIGPFADAQGGDAGFVDRQRQPRRRGDAEGSTAREPAGQGELMPKGTEILTADKAGFDEALKAARQADVVVMTLGESGPEMTGEASSRAHLDLPGNQEQLLEAVVGMGKPVVLVLVQRTPARVALGCGTCARDPRGLVSGNRGWAGAGRTCSQARRTRAASCRSTFLVRWGRSRCSTRSFRPGVRSGDLDVTRPPANNAEKYLSRYIDESNTAQWPFGWGLSYTRFSYSAPSLSQKQVSAGTAAAQPQTPLLKVAVDVKNTGAVAGSEVVQLYVRTTVASVEQPLRELKGFERITLAPGEQKHVEFPLSFEDLSFYNVDLQRVMEPTTVQVWVGGDSNATQSAQFEVTK